MYFYILHYDLKLGNTTFVISLYVKVVVTVLCLGVQHQYMLMSAFELQRKEKLVLLHI